MPPLKFRALEAPPNSKFLRGLDKQEIDSIFAEARLRRFRASSVMTDQGDPADHLFLLWRGRARYFFDTANGHVAQQSGMIGYHRYKEGLQEDSKMANLAPSMSRSGRSGLEI